MKEFNITQKRYKCDNCGATYSNPDNIKQCPITNKEICKKCGLIVENIFTVNYNGDPYDFYFEDKNVLVHPSATQNQFDWWRDEYVQEVSKLQETFAKKLKELNTAYLSDKLRDYQKGGCDV